MADIRETKRLNTADGVRVINRLWRDNNDGTFSEVVEGGGGGGGGGGGDASAANQVTGNNSLASIDSKIGDAAESPTQYTLLDRLKSIAGYLAGILSVGGSVAHDAADSGSPVKVGGRARTSLIGAVSNDDRVDFVSDQYGRQEVVIGNGGGTFQYAIVTGSFGDGVNLSGALRTHSIPMLWNGTNFDRFRGDTTNGLDVDVTRSALPTGAATSAKQDTAIARLGLFHPVDGDNDEFSDSAAAEIGPLAVGRVWVKLVGGDGHIQIGSSPSPSTSSSPPLTEGADYYFDVEAGDTVAVIGVSGESGTLYVATEAAIPG